MRLVPVRLKIEIKARDKAVSEIALLNSGYEAPTPQLLIPISTARKLNLWPPTQESQELEVDTAGGPLRVWYYARSAYVKIVTEENVQSREVLTDILVSPLADEPLISDLLADELEIAVESFGRGLWRFRWEPPGKLRASERRT